MIISWERALQLDVGQHTCVYSVIYMRQACDSTAISIVVSAFGVSNTNSINFMVGSEMIRCRWNLNIIFIFFLRIVTMISAGVRVHYVECVQMNWRCLRWFMRLNEFLFHYSQFFSHEKKRDENEKINDILANTLANMVVARWWWRRWWYSCFCCRIYALSRENLFISWQVPRGHPPLTFSHAVYYYYYYYYNRAFYYFSNVINHVCIVCTAARSIM